METVVEVGLLGATKQSWRTRSIRALITELVHDYPESSEAKLLREFINRCGENEEDMEAALTYAFHNNYRALVKAAATAAEKAKTAARKAKEAAKYAETVTQHAERVQSVKEQIMLLNLEMPNGKRLRHCTGFECAKFKGWFQELAKAGSKTIGEVYDERALKALYNKKMK